MFPQYIPPTPLRPFYQLPQMIEQEKEKKKNMYHKIPFLDHTFLK